MPLLYLIYIRPSRRLPARSPAAAERRTDYVSSLIGLPESRRVARRPSEAAGNGRRQDLRPTRPHRAETRTAHGTESRFSGGCPDIPPPPGRHRAVRHPVSARCREFFRAKNVQKSRLSTAFLFF